MADVSVLFAIDLYISIFALFLYLILTIHLFYLRKCSIELSAQLVILFYPIGIIAATLWRHGHFGFNGVGLFFIVFFHNFVVILPSYMIFQIRRVRILVSANSHE